MTNIRILGTGTSTGVPTIGCTCPVCQSADPRDSRLRTSVLYEEDHTQILLDCGPDFRQQILPLPFKPLQAVLLTHEHFDHVAGIDDLRSFSYRSELPIYTNKLTAIHLEQRMPYCFIDKSYPGIPKLALKVVEPYKTFSVGTVAITPISIMHGELPIFGYRLNKMAYITDMLYMPEASFEKLQGLEVLILNALRIKLHSTHESLSQAIEVAKRVGARRTYLVHMSHDIGLHAQVEKQLPEGIFIGYDGQTIEY